MNPKKLWKILSKISDDFPYIGCQSLSNRPIPTVKNKPTFITNIDEDETSEAFQAAEQVSVSIFIEEDAFDIYDKTVRGLVSIHSHETQEQKNKFLYALAGIRR